MSKFLIPVDGSEASLRAVEAAVKASALINGAELLVINVQSPIVSGNVKRFFSAEVLQEYYQDEGRTALAPVKEFLDKAGVRYTDEVVVGPVADTIASYARTQECTSIFMGTRGLGLVTGLVLGSIATKVISLSDIPVTLIK
ncbi:universal stress protein [Allopusillimonas ginsengisoli]|uniref:universal stress protein n=1 Tax=Allopusillimonas ginsengisoli TaxID=453575 RepID=UPI0010C19110|nr:universal stress protein [Allopusillimonas ginsengisoli]